MNKQCKKTYRPIYGNTHSQHGREGVCEENSYESPHTHSLTFARPNHNLARPWSKDSTQTDNNK